MGCRGFFLGGRIFFVQTHLDSVVGYEGVDFSGYQ